MVISFLLNAFKSLSDKLQAAIQGNLEQSIIIPAH